MMRGKIFVLRFVSAVFLFISAANAMSVPQYDHLASNDQTTYVMSLLKGAVIALDNHGKPDQSKKLIALFADSSDHGGATQFEKDLQLIRSINQQNASDPRQPQYEVEHAMALTLKNNGIIVPVSVLLAINKDFKPSAPPANK
jgi:hypothetical protein